MEQKDLLPVVALIVAALALLCSFLTFFYAHWRPPRLTLGVGDYLNLSYNSHKKLGFWLRCIIANDGAWTGVVASFRGSINRDGLECAKLIADVFFKSRPRQEQDHKPVGIPSPRILCMDKVPEPILITGRSAVIQNVCMITLEPFKFEAGDYTVCLEGYSQFCQKVVAGEFNLHVEEETAEKLKNNGVRQMPRFRYEMEERRHVLDKRGTVPGLDGIFEVGDN